MTTSTQIANAAIAHEEDNGELNTAAGDMEAALEVALKIIDRAGLSDSFQREFDESPALDSLRDYL